MTTSRARLLGLVALAVVLATVWPSPAAAQRTGFAIDRFEPAEHGSRFFVADTLELRGAARPAFGAVFDYAYKPLVVYDKDGNDHGALVRHQLFTHLGGSIVIGGVMRFALNAPVALYQDGEESVIGGEVFKAADKPAIGDLRFAADLALIGDANDPFRMAFGLRVWAPTGQRSQFTGDGSTRMAPQLLAAGHLGPIAYGARLASVWRPRNDPYAGAALGSEVLGVAAAGIETSDRRLLVGPEIYATSVVGDNEGGRSGFLKSRETPAEWLFGLHYDATSDVRIGAGVGAGFTRGYGAPQLRTVVTAEWAPAYELPDRDHDTVPDREDGCPDVAGVRTDDRYTNGCPLPPPADRDRDGVIDVNDACPDDAGVASEDPQKNGCPPPPPDTDGDGIL